jgi:hypothetical protein
VAAVSIGYDTCDRCGGTGYRPVPFTRSLYCFPCRGCKGSGLRERLITRVWRLLRHGTRSLTEGEY